MRGSRGNCQWAEMPSHSLVVRVNTAPFEALAFLTYPPILWIRRLRQNGQASSPGTTSELYLNSRTFSYLSFLLQKVRGGRTYDLLGKGNTVSGNKQ